jgi:hypothetical protein
MPFPVSSAHSSAPGFWDGARAGSELPADQQELALSACFKEVYNGSQKPARILLPVRNLQFWIDANILLVLKDAPFNKRDPELVTAAGSCADCPKRTGHNKLLFGDDLGRQGDRCTDPGCYQAKVAAHVAKTVAARPELVQISTAYGVQGEGSPVLPRNKYTAIRDEKPKSKDAPKRLDAIYVLELRRLRQSPAAADDNRRWFCHASRKLLFSCLWCSPDLKPMGKLLQQQSGFRGCQRG